MRLSRMEYKRLIKTVMLGMVKGNTTCKVATENAGAENAIRSKMQRLQMWEQKNREQIAGGGKCRSRLVVWKAEPISHSLADIIQRYGLKLLP